jgi:AcrR family transcriptional regulator
VTEGKRLPRAERREQILAAATEAFADTGFAATSLDDVAAAAGISRVILYRHFESKNDLYRAVVDLAVDRMVEVTNGELTENTLGALLTWAGDDPAGFRLLFRHAAREPEFRQEIDELRGHMADAVFGHVAGEVSDERWARWVAQLSSAVVVEAIMAWLDAGRPDPEQALDRIGRALDGVLAAVE